MKKFRIGIMGAGRGIDIAENFMLLGCEITALCENNEKELSKDLKGLARIFPFSRILMNF